MVCVGVVVGLSCQSESQTWVNKMSYSVCVCTKGSDSTCVHHSPHISDPQIKVSTWYPTTLRVFQFVKLAEFCQLQMMCDIHLSVVMNVGCILYLLLLLFYNFCCVLFMVCPATVYMCFNIILRIATGMYRLFDNNYKFIGVRQLYLSVSWCSP